MDACAIVNIISISFITTITFPTDTHNAGMGMFNVLLKLHLKWVGPQLA
jgi:hypothetical protein